MDKKIVIFAFALIMTVFSGVYLYAQEDDGDAADSPEADGAGVVIIPDDDELASLLTESRHSGTVVGPLLKTKWGQGVPYRNMLPAGHRSFCNLVAASQIMKYHSHPARGKGQSAAYTMKNGVEVPPLNFNVAYDWDNMLNTYRRDGKGSDERQRNAAATLIYHAGVGRGRDFITGNSKNPWPLVLTAFFGYDKSIQNHYRAYYDDASWEAMIREQLDAGLPVLCNGRNQTTNHYFVIDGYDNTGKFHINFGWSGKHDGWYPLNAVREWNRNQYIVTNIKPDKGGVPAGYEMALSKFTAGKTSVPQNELFTVTAAFRNVSALDTFPGGQAGVALVDANGKIAEVIGRRNTPVRRPGGVTSSYGINCFVTEAVRPGQYRVVAVIRPTGGEWKVITKSAVGNGVPNAINITITAGEAMGGGYGLTLENFSSEKNAVHPNDRFTVTVKPRNLGADAFGGQAGAALVDNNGNIAAVLGTKNISIRSGNQLTAAFNCTVPNTAVPGQYKLRIVVKPKNAEQWKIATLSMPDVPNSIDFLVAEPGAPIPPPSAPVGKPVEKEAAPVVAPVNQQAAPEPVTGMGNLSVIPSPVIRTSSRTATFYWQGKRVSATALPVYDSSDKLVSGVEINDGAASGSEGAKRRVGVWDLKDLDGRPVPAGRYTVRGVLKTPDGEPVRVELKIDVR
ncbi:MAG: C10 family peptidase [Chitinispirillia bacterium]|nr:C10 family peptidase [Chitinispirillia bacterium]MCL2241943.1 C10 family peptidase [Chitinispirillia bacterium]